MATAAYTRWVNDGKPLTPAQPIREIVDGLKEAYPDAAAAHLFSWYADNAHYQADRPQDHTPFSVTGWPIVNPYPYVCATDVMHRPDLGVNCFDLFDYWIAEARAGRMPWLKYLIWQGKSYDVRSGLVAHSADDHYDHIHLSVRTDHIHTSLAGWRITPLGDDVPLYFGYGAEGDHVLELQMDLLLLGQDLGTTGPWKNGVDGKYGNRVAAALVNALKPWVGGDSTGHTYGPGERQQLKLAVARKAAATTPVPTGDGVSHSELNALRDALLAEVQRLARTDADLEAAAHRVLSAASFHMV